MTSYILISQQQPPVNQVKSTIIIHSIWQIKPLKNKMNKTELLFFFREMDVKWEMKEGELEDIGNMAHIISILKGRKPLHMTFHYVNPHPLFPYITLIISIIPIFPLLSLSLSLVFGCNFWLIYILFCMSCVLPNDPKHMSFFHTLCLSQHFKPIHSS